MKRLWQRLWMEEDGVVFSTEMVLLGSVLVVGSAVGLNAVRDGVNTELNDVARAIGSIDQTYYYSGVQGHGAYTAGSAYFDQADETDVDPKRIKVCADVFEPKPKRQVVPPNAVQPPVKSKVEVQPAPAKPQPAVETPPPVKTAGPAASNCPHCNGPLVVIHNYGHAGTCVTQPCATAHPPVVQHYAPRPAPVVVPCPPLAQPCAPVHQRCQVLPPTPPPCSTGWQHGHGMHGALAPYVGPGFVPEGIYRGSKVTFPPPGAHFQHPLHAVPPTRPSGMTAPAADTGVEVRVQNGSNADLHQVVSIPDVAELIVAGQQVTNDGLGVLPRLAGLELLELNGVGVDDGASFYLAQLRSLRELRLINVGLSDASLVPLKSLVGLRTLHLEQTRVTPEGAARFRAALPHVEVNLVR